MAGRPPSIARDPDTEQEFRGLWVDQQVPSAYLQERWGVCHMTVIREARRLGLPARRPGRKPPPPDPEMVETVWKRCEACDGKYQGAHCPCWGYGRTDGRR